MQSPGQFRALPKLAHSPRRCNSAPLGHTTKARALSSSFSVNQLRVHLLETEGAFEFLGVQRGVIGGVEEDPFRSDSFDC